MAQPQPAIYPFVSQQKRTKTLVTLVILDIVFTLISLVLGLLNAAKLTAAQAAGGVDESYEAFDGLQRIFGFMQISLFLVTAILFLMWVHQGYKNLTALEAVEMRFTPGWAVGYFFIPFLNIIRGYEVVADLWKASGQEARNEGGLGWKKLAVPGLLTIWWVAWLVSGFIGRQVAAAAIRADSIDALLHVSRISFLSDLFSLLPSVLFILVLKDIDERQTESHTLLLSGGSTRNHTPTSWPPPIPQVPGR